MRIWDVKPACLCRKHLLGEHRELHGLWNIYTKHKGRGGYAHHPETKRWQGKLAALYVRHEALVREMTRRGYQHHSPLDRRKATGLTKQTIFIDTVAQQKKLLMQKPCACLLD